MSWIVKIELCIYGRHIIGSIYLMMQMTGMTIIKQQSLCILKLLCFAMAELILTHKWLETYECILRTVATDALVLRHQAISIYSVGFITQCNGPVSCRNIKVFINKILFVSISEGPWKLLGCLFFIFCQFHVNNMILRSPFGRKMFGYVQWTNTQPCYKRINNINKISISHKLSRCTEWFWNGQF